MWERLGERPGTPAAANLYIIYGMTLSQHLHLDVRPRHQVSMTRVHILNQEDDQTTTGIKASIYIRMLHLDLNADGGRHHLPPIWDKLLEVSCDFRSQDAV